MSDAIRQVILKSVSGGVAHFEAHGSGQDLASWAEIERQLQAALRHRLLFLSGSVPDSQRDPDAEHKHLPHQVFARYQASWPSFCDAMRDRRAREVQRAVSWICREAFSRDYTLVFGGHPAISPMVLEIARQELGSGAEIRVLIFQARVFEGVLTEAAKDLARWPHGCMIFTDPPGDMKNADDRQRCLTRMRELMTSLPNLTAAVFVGGMSGLLEETDLFAAHVPGAPRYAIASTGGAAAFLLNQREAGHRGSGEARLINALRSSPSYGAVATRIFHDIEHGGA